MTDAERPSSETPAAGHAPVYDGKTLRMMVQKTPVFKHCHDVCVDTDDDLYVCQWNADKTQPIKLHRV